MGARENKVETYLDACVKQVGGLTRKWTSNVCGVTDRIVVLKGVFLVEVKVIDGKLSSVQKREHIRLAKAGTQVYTVFGKSGVDAFMILLEEGINYEPDYDKRIINLR